MLIFLKIYLFVSIIFWIKGAYDFWNLSNKSAETIANEIREIGLVEHSELARRIAKASVVNLIVNIVLALVFLLFL